MSLRELIMDFRPPKPPRLANEPLVAAAAAEIVEKFDARVDTLDPEEAKVLLGRFREAQATGEWENVSARDWRKIPMLVFAGDHPLAEMQGFLNRLLSVFQEKPTRAKCNALISAYIYEFDPARPSLLRLASELRTMVRSFDWAWSKRQDQVGFFSPEEAPQRIAAACLSSAEGHAPIMSSFGLTGSRISSKLAKHAWRQALEKNRQALGRPEADLRHLDTLLGWSTTGKALTYPEPDERAALAESLLLPFQARTVPDTVREAVVGFLLAHFRDPRLPIHRKDWLGVNEEAVAVLRKWLTGVALEQFFDVVDQVAQESMWRYRKAFWLAYYRADMIDDAWVLFGPDAQVHARDTFGKTQSYGRLSGSGTKSNHSVLLMRIGKLTVADWSHSGKCHIWRDGNPDAPTLYKASYYKYELGRGSNNNGLVHGGSENGTWQAKIERFIRDETGVRIFKHDYMPTER